MKKIFFLFLLLLLVFFIFHIAIGVIPWQISLLHHDYPGPKSLTNIQDQTSKRAPDWLLIHGVSMDARLWKDVLKHHPETPMIALSLSYHEQGPQFAYPNQLAAIDLNRYLQTYKPRVGVIGHSTAALWIADAYRRSPSLWQGLKIILLAPNTGTNIQSNFKVSSSRLAFLKIVMPNPYFAFTQITACKGVNNYYYLQCKTHYLAGRLLRLASIPYFQKLFTYMMTVNQTRLFENFVLEKHKDIEIFVPDNDFVLNSKKTVELAKQFAISFQVIPETSHHGIMMKDYIWMPKKLSYIDSHPPKLR